MDDAVKRMIKEFIKNTIEKMYLSEIFFVHKLAVLAYFLNQQKKLGLTKTGRGKIHASITVDSSIPQLSWICKIQNQDYTFKVGKSVEFSDHFILEGAWDGDFCKAKELKQSQYVFGSGAVIEKRKITFIPPKHIFECIYLLVDKKNKITGVSNSLLFLLSELKMDPEDGFFKDIAGSLHQHINIASERGIDRYSPKILENQDYACYRMLYYNFSVNSAGNIGIKLLFPKVPFTDFNEYKSFLENKIRLVMRNANAEKRKKKYQPITTISRGYDSPTVSVLAKNCGCREALTLDVSVYGFDDSGAQIAGALGYTVYKYKHVMADFINSSNIEYLNTSFMDENLQKIALEFIATGGIGDDIVYYPFEEKLPQRVLMTGSFGDSMWTRNSSVKPGLSCTIPFMKSITEFRIRTGFVFFSIPFLGARFPRAVIKISGSAELKTFSNNTDYDRPICRKIVGEAGIPQDWFGIQKSATAPLIMNHDELLDKAMIEIMQRYQPREIGQAK